MPDSADWEWLRGEVRTSAAAFADQLRTVTDTGVRVPNLEWSVAELAAHVASLPHLSREQDRIGADFELPADWPAYAAAVRAHITTTDRDELADLIVAEVETVIEPDDPDEVRMMYGRETTVAKSAAGLLIECILHGQDLGRLTGYRPTLGRRQALAGLEEQLVLAPVFVDPPKAAALAGTYGLRFRGGPDVTFVIDGDGRLTVEPGWPDRADARLNADPATFVMSSLGRVNPITAGLTGKLVAYGRKPWRLTRLGDITIDGI